MLNLSLTNEAWLSKLKKHLDTEHYGVGSVNQYMGVARRFLADIEEQHLSITAVQPANIEFYLQQAAWVYPDRHEHSPDYRHWRRTAIHMLLRLAQGQWPPTSRSITAAEISRREICEEYAKWMIGFRGLAPTTVLCASNEASRFLGWLGECATRENLSFLTVFDVDTYMKMISLL
jgi:integrase/recombinase XerD